LFGGGAELLAGNSAGEGDNWAAGKPEARRQRTMRLAGSTVLNKTIEQMRPPMAERAMTSEIRSVLKRSAVSTSARIRSGAGALGAEFAGRTRG